MLTPLMLLKATSFIIHRHIVERTSQGEATICMGIYRKDEEKEMEKIEKRDTSGHCLQGME